MDDLISRKALLEKAWEADTQCGYVQVVDVGDIEDATAVDAAPVVHGRWIFNQEQWTWDCTNCKGWVGSGVRIRGYEYCPNCGAKMNGGNDNDCQRGDCSF